MPRLREALADSPAVLVHGPRQCGKTTLARLVGEPRGYRYVSFDDEAVATAATADPVGFVSDLPTRTILGEVQRVPEIFTSLEAAIDRRRSAGRFVLPGSANVLLVPTLAESLAGRWRSCACIRSPKARSGAGDRAWYRDHVEAQILRDVRDPSRLRSLDTLPRLLAFAAAKTGRLVKVADLASPFESTGQTIHEHVALLERVFLLERLPAWHANRLSRLVKRPKLHVGDTGVACALLGVDADRLTAERPLLGALLETFVFQELRRQASWLPEPVEFFHFRDRDDFEVDIVLEQGALAVAGVDVKAAATVKEADLRGLRKLRAVAGKRFVAGVVIYDGSAAIAFGDGLFAVPVRRLWEAA